MLSRSLLMVALDFETTGFGCKADIVQFAAVSRLVSNPLDGKEGKGVVTSTLEQKEPGLAFETYVFTEQRIHAKASQVTGINNETIRDAPKFTVVWDKFTEWLKPQVNDTLVVCLCGHNLWKFDLPLLYRSLKSNSCANDGEALLHQMGVRCVLDTLEYSRRQFRLLASHKLTSLYRHVMQRDLTNAHSALADAQAVLDIVLHCLADATRTKTLWSCRHSLRSTKNTNPLTDTASVKPPSAPTSAPAEASVSLLTLTTTSEQTCKQCQQVYSTFFTHPCHQRSNAA